MNVKEIMTKNPATCLPNAKLNEAAKLMLDNSCGEIPVIKAKDNPELVGVVTDRDICCRAVAEGRNPSTTSVSEVMSSPVFTITADTDVAKSCKTFSDKEVRLTDLAEHAPEQYAREILRNSGKSASQHVV
jgi:CBS domain-containing protein